MHNEVSTENLVSLAAKKNRCSCCFHFSISCFLVFVLRTLLWPRREWFEPFGKARQALADSLCTSRFWKCQCCQTDLDYIFTDY